MYIMIWLLDLVTSCNQIQNLVDSESGYIFISYMLMDDDLILLDSNRMDSNIIGVQ